VMFDVLRSDLEGVEHLSGALGVDGRGAESAEDLINAKLDGDRRVSKGEVDRPVFGLCGLACAGHGGVETHVEVAICLATQGHCVTFFAVGLDVPALWCHRVIPPLMLLQANIVFS